MKKKQILRIIIMTVGICLGFCLVTGVVGITAYNVMIHKEEEPSIIEEEQAIGEAEVNAEEVLEEKKQINKTVAVLGTDQDGERTDVILIVHFKSDSNETDVISIPRDTKVDWKSDQKACLPPRQQWVSISKINEMTHYSQMDSIRGTLINEIEAILGVKVDNYVMVSLDTFRRIVDAVGGVEVDIPRRMKWDDYSQGLHIDLHPGVQLLDGEKAEQFVRFRSYPQGDVDRIAAQQQFLEAFADKVISPQVMTKIPEIVGVLFTSLMTDIAFTELIEYYPYLKDIDLSQVNFHTLPGVGAYENGVSYYFKDMEKVEILVNEVFFGN